MFAHLVAESTAITNQRLLDKDPGLPPLRYMGVQSYTAEIGGKAGDGTDCARPDVVGRPPPRGRTAVLRFALRGS
jgi:hypothetical protein